MQLPAPKLSEDARAGLDRDTPRSAGLVLIVDDVPDNLAVLHDALDAAGYTVLVATDGASVPCRPTRTSCCSMP
jgi:PleD family two-component response regulator